MMNMTTQKRSDTSIATGVTAELFFDPKITTSDIQAKVTNGRVTLTGISDTYATKWEADSAAYRVAGVRSVDNLITVGPGLLGLLTDDDILAAVRVKLNADATVPAGKINVSCFDGRITLTGDVEWYFQRLAAERTAGSVRGVSSVNSEIRILPMVASPESISADIKNALVRSAVVDARHIEVKVDGAKVTLSGQVHSWSERTEAMHTAWRAKGVADVIDNITLTF